MVTRVDRPFLDRQATVYEFDHRWNPNSRLGIRTTVVGSEIQQPGAPASDTGAQVQVDYDMGNDWRQQLYALHLGDGLQLNDFGYLERNNFNYLRYQLSHRVSTLPETSAYASHDFRYAVSRRANDHGVHIADAWSFDLVSDLRDGGNDFFEVAGFTPGHDDRITRGNNVLDVPGKFYLFYERFRPRKDRWSWYWHGRYAAEGLDGPRYGALELDLNPTYFVNDNLSIYAELFAQHNPDWLVWQHDNVLGSYRADT
jgi:hypothetical protein